MNKIDDILGGGSYYNSKNYMEMEKQRELMRMH